MIQMSAKCCENVCHQSVFYETISIILIWFASIASLICVDTPISWTKCWHTNETWQRTMQRLLWKIWFASNRMPTIAAAVVPPATVHCLSNKSRSMSNKRFWIIQIRSHRRHLDLRLYLRFQRRYIIPQLVLAINASMSLNNLWFNGREPAQTHSVNYANDFS